MSKPSIIDQAREFTASREGQELLDRLSSSPENAPTRTDDVRELCADSDQYRFNHNNLDHVPTSSAASTGYGGDSYGGARWGAGPPPGKEKKEEKNWKWDAGIDGGINSRGMDSAAVRNYGKGESM
ncbi:hypothetical protein JCM6882_003490 [Rhodosporidiobolus microsporus]